MRDHIAYGHRAVSPSSVTALSTQRQRIAQSAARRCCVGVWDGEWEAPARPAGAWAERALCVCGGCGGGAGNGIGAEGAAAVARALESGRCGLTTLDLGSKWGALVLSVAYHCAALQCAALYC